MIVITRPGGLIADDVGRRVGARPTSFRERRLRLRRAESSNGAHLTYQALPRDLRVSVRYLPTAGLALRSPSPQTLLRSLTNSAEIVTSGPCGMPSLQRHRRASCSDLIPM